MRDPAGHVTVAAVSLFAWTAHAVEPDELPTEELREVVREADGDGDDETSLHWA